MANRTVKDASSIHGTNPQYLVEKIIRTRIYDSKYWKEECFALTAELLVDKAMALRYIGGVFGGNIKPSPFLCLILKMLQIQPEKDIVIEFIKQDEFKYVRALGCFYLRLVHPSLDCYKYLGPLLNDYRKLRLMDRSGVFQLSYMDQFIDNLLREERFCDVIMPRIQRRWVHEANNELEPRISLLEDDLDDLESESEDEDDAAAPSSPPIPPSPHHRAERSRHSPNSRDKRRHSPSPSPEPSKRRRDKDRDRGTRDKTDTRRHRDSGRGDRDRGAGDHYGSYPAEAYHDYHHGGGSHDYHGNMANSTDYHHRRPHHNNGVTANAPHHMGDSYHQSHRGGGDNYHHRGGGGEDYHHGRGGGEDYYHHREAEDDYHHRGTGGDEHSSRKREHRRGEESGRRAEEGSRRGEESGRRDERKKEGRDREGRRKEGRSRRDGGGSLQAEIDEANALRAKLGLPPLK